jgi:hypothetical protein
LIALASGLTVIALMFVALWRFHFRARFLPVIAIAIIIIGIGALSQPWIKILYRYGLAVLMTGVAAYILVSHFE